MSVTLVNLSSLITTVQLQNIITGLNLLLIKFANDWKLGPCICIVGPITTPGCKMCILDNADCDAGAGAKIFVQPILENGGTIYDDVSRSIAHEVMEILINPYFNIGWQLHDASLECREVCHPVKDSKITIKVGAQNIAYNEWVLPKWTDINQKTCSKNS